jgi:hypothetical protein
MKAPTMTAPTATGSALASPTIGCVSMIGFVSKITRT